MTNRAPEWLFRADASESIGVGHVMRCLTLAEEAIARGRRCRVLSHRLPPLLADRAAALRVEVVPVTCEPGSATDGAATKTAAEDAEVLVLDGYHLGARFRRGLGSWPGTLMAIDDNLESNVRDVDVILNHAPHAPALGYEGRAHLLLLGPAYALLRREVTELLPVTRLPRRPDRVVVTLGGADVLAATVPLCRALLDRTDFRIDAVIGPANLRGADITELASERPDRVAAIHADSLPTALARSDLGIVAAGGTLWEAAALGLPTVAVVTADNQAFVANTPPVNSFAIVHDLRHQGAVERVALEICDLAADDAHRMALGAAGQALVDGCGTSRAVAAVIDLLHTRAKERSDGA